MMNEIRCPKCGEVFKVDESNYAAIVQQVRDSEFKRDVEEQAALPASGGSACGRTVSAAAQHGIPGAGRTGGTETIE